VSAPLWDSKTSTFGGLLTTSDYINVIQYYWQNPEQLHLIDQFTLNSLREIEKAIGAPQIETVSIHPERPLYEACKMMVVSRARRIPLVDIDDETKRAMVVSVVTQYRILKFVAVNVKETQKLKKPLKELRVGTYEGVATASMESPVMDVIHMLVKMSISSVPILDKDGAVINVFEAVDVIMLIKGGVYEDLNLTVGEALLKRADVGPGHKIYKSQANFVAGLWRHIHLLAVGQTRHDLRHDTAVASTPARHYRRKCKIAWCTNVERHPRVRATGGCGSRG
jgi:CBS domain-containing protein